MNKDVYKYFTDFSKLGLKHNHNIIDLNQEGICEHTQDEYRDERKISFYDRPCYIKYGSSPDSIYGIASSRMYGNLGILTPQTFPVHQDPNKPESYHIASEDVFSIPGLIVSSPNYVLDELYRSIPYQARCGTKFWTGLYNEEHKNLFLQSMTTECYEELMLIYLLDTLRTDSDRHYLNYFFYKLPGSDKWQGIIPIDLEFAETTRFLFKFI